MLQRRLVSSRLTFTLIKRGLSNTSSVEKYIKPQDTFAKRHLGPNQKDAESMLKAIGVSSFEELISQVIPKSIRHDIKDTKFLKTDGLSETEALDKLRSLADSNQIFRNFIGQGYYGTKTPGVILRNMLENPAWYTAYTPYQSEVSQGRLEMLLNFQTMVKDLTQMEIANCSLLDEGTSAAEAMGMSHAHHRNKRNKFFVSKNLFKQSIGCIQTRADPLGIELVIEDEFEFLEKVQKNPKILDSFSGVIVQSPNKYGIIKDFGEFSKTIQNSGVVFTMATDLLSLVLNEGPGAYNADIVVGTAQRFGVPMFFGGPHAGFMSIKEQFTRLMPGRLIGVSKDANGKNALRMALQTREQFIKREKATSNICTAQALLANVAAAYSIFHGPEGLKNIAKSVHVKAVIARNAIAENGFEIVGGNERIFDTFAVKVDSSKSQHIMKRAADLELNFFKHDDGSIGISFDETSTEADLKAILSVFDAKSNYDVKDNLDARKTKFMTHPLFNSMHSETKLLRYLASLEAKDLTLRNSMIPLGSCTMKLNATSELIPISWPEFAGIHPFAPKSQTKGFNAMIEELNSFLSEVTGFAKVSSQPNSGANGEYAGLLAIKKYHESRGEGNRNVCLIPMSAHGTNPASAAMAGMKIVGVKNTKTGEVDLEDLRAKAEKYKKDLSCLMITYPSTYGVFEKDVKEIIKICKDNGGRVYMDGANMNAQLMHCSPGAIGADVCHLNLHKTFAIPHGGGGPGVGSIGVCEDLKEFLPGHNVVDIEGSAGQVSAAPFGSAGILPIPWMFISMLGRNGLKKCSETAILNANYMATKLKENSDFDVMFLNENERCAHEFILDLRFLAKHGLSEGDVAKRLADYGFHAATMSWPVAGTMMIEPTESESKEECDRFIQAMKQIKKEVDKMIADKVDPENSILRNAPHSMDTLLDDKLWNSKERNYTREEAAFPLHFVKHNKFWPSARVDNVFGDRNLVCSCPSMEEFESH